MAVKIDARRPLYAVVGATEMAVEQARQYAADVSARFAKVDLEPAALSGRVEAYVNEAVAEVTEAYEDLAVRGEALVRRMRSQQSTQDAQAAGEATPARARGARRRTTQSATGSAARSTGAAKRTAGTTRTRRTAGSAKRTTRSTGTSARKSTAATTKATADAGGKVGD